MHDLLYRLARPALMRFLAPEQAHGLAVAALKRGVVRASPPPDDPILATRVFGLDFTNPIGLAAGRQDAHYRRGWEEKRKAGEELVPGLIDLPDRLPEVKP